MKREGKDKSWDFLFDCNENQWQLINDIMGGETESLANIASDLEEHDFPKHYATRIKANVNNHKGGLFYGICSDVEGYYLTYGDFLNGIIDEMDNKPQTKLSSLEKYEREENIILLYCLKRFALEQPKFFKSLYNLASTSAEDVVEELEIRFCTSPALRASLPAVLCSCMAKEHSIQLSRKGKKAIDENLTSLEEASMLGNYHYAGSLGKLNSLDGLWALGGPVGILIGMAFHVGKELFSDKNKSEKKNEDNEEEQEDCTFALACALIMLRRDVCGISWNEKRAYNNVCKWMDDCSYSLSAEGHKQEEKAFVESLFLKILKAKDEDRYRLVMNSYGYTEEHHTRIDEKIDAKIKLLLPHAAYLVEKLWDKLIADHSKDYYYTMPQLSARMTGNTCLMTEFHPDFVDNESRVHFLVDNTSRAGVMLCLELMGHDSTAICKDLSSLKKEYDHIFVSNETQRVEMHSYLNHRLYHGRVYSLYANFGGITKTEHCDDSEIMKLREELLQVKEELNECQMQITEYEKKEQFWEIAAHSFRHLGMAEPCIAITNALDYLKLKGNDFDQRIFEIEDAVKEMGAYIDSFGKLRKFGKASLGALALEVFGDSINGVPVKFNSYCEGEDLVLLEKYLFKQYVLENIKKNIQRHAFPEGNDIVSPRVDITIKENKNEIILAIGNNGERFEGNDQDAVFERNRTFGDTGNTGEGLYHAKWYMETFHPEPQGEIHFYSFPSEENKVVIEIKFTKSK